MHHIHPHHSVDVETLSHEACWCEELTGSIIPKDTIMGSLDFSKDFV